MKKLLIALSMSLLSLSVFAHTEKEREDGYNYTYSCGETDFDNLKAIYLYLHDTKFMTQANAIKNNASECNIVAFAIDPSFDNGWVDNDMLKSMIQDGIEMGVPLYIEVTPN